MHRFSSLSNVLWIYDNTMIFDRNTLIWCCYVAFYLSISLFSVLLSIACIWSVAFGLSLDAVCLMDQSYVILVNKIAGSGKKFATRNWTRILTYCFLFPVLNVSLSHLFSLIMMDFSYGNYYHLILVKVFGFLYGCLRHEGQQVNITFYVTHETINLVK